MILGLRRRILGLSLALASVSGFAGTVSVEPVTITKQPVKALKKTVGQAVAFSVTAEGSSLEYQWKINNDDIPGATGSTLTISPIPNEYFDNGNLVNPGSNNISVAIGNLSSFTNSVQVPFTVIADSKIPTITTISPVNKKSYATNANPYEFSIGGTAKDDARVARVSYSLNGGDFVPATITSLTNGPLVSWTNIVSVIPGLNTLSVFSTDYSGLDSVTQNLSFFYDVWSPFTLQVDSDPVLEGAGTNGFIIKSTADVKLGTNNGNYPLLVGRSYSLTVVPNITNGYIFAGFTASSDENPEEHIVLDYLYDNTFTLNYVMESNMVITALFVTNQFRTQQGTYNGLFAESDENRQDSAGYVTLKMNEKRGFSGKLLLDGDAVSISGKFDVEGFAIVTAKRGVKFNKDDLFLLLGVDLCGCSETIEGYVVDPSAGWLSELTADRLVWGKTWENITNASTIYSNAYTMVLPGFVDTNAGPAGWSHASVLVNNKGMVKVTGATADGQKISQATTISRDGYWPFFAPLYTDTNDVNLLTGKPIKRTRGMMMGWMTFGSGISESLVAGKNESIDLAPSGGVTWIKTPWTNANWASGFTNDAFCGIEVTSSVHIPAAPGDSLYPAGTTNFLATMEEGGIDPLSNLFYLKTNNTFAVDAKNTTVEPVYNHLFKVSLANKLGTVKGSFTNELGMKINWSGVMLQDLNSGFGSFMSTNLVNGSGIVTLEPYSP